MDLLQEIVRRTRVESRLQIGVSPRGAVALFKASRAYAMVQGRTYPRPRRYPDHGGSLFGPPPPPGGHGRFHRRSPPGSGGNPGRDHQGGPGSRLMGLSPDVRRSDQERGETSSHRRGRDSGSYGDASMPGGGSDSPGPGSIFTLGSFAVGFAAFNTGNNLLYLLFGAMLGLIVVSGWLSEQVIREPDRASSNAPRSDGGESPVRIQYEVENRRRRIPSFALEVGEAGLPGTGFLPLIRPGDRASARSENRFVHRGVFRLEAVTISTSFPFGLFLKSRDIRLKGEMVVWPRSDRNVRPPGSRRRQKSPVGFSLRRIRRPERGIPRAEELPPWGRSPGHPLAHHRPLGPARGAESTNRHETEALWLCLDTRGKPGDRARSPSRWWRLWRPEPFGKGGASAW